MGRVEPRSSLSDGGALGGLMCLPPLPCGELPGSPCCADDACSGTDVFGNQLACGANSQCEVCGIEGAVPCAGMLLSLQCE